MRKPECRMSKEAPSQARPWWQNWLEDPQIEQDLQEEAAGA